MAIQARAGAADARLVEILNDLAAEWESRDLLLVAAIVGGAILVPFLTLVHELGHAVAALALRRQLIELRVGDQDPIFTFRIRGLRVLLGPTSDEGTVGGYLRYRDSAPGPWVILVIALAGPVASLAGAVMTGFALVSLPPSSFSYILLIATLGGVVVFWNNLLASGDDPSEWSDGSWIRFALRELRAQPRA